MSGAQRKPHPARAMIAGAHRTAGDTRFVYACTALVLQRGGLVACSEAITGMVLALNAAQIPLPPLLDGLADAAASVLIAAALHDEDAFASARHELQLVLMEYLVGKLGNELGGEIDF